jgi:hypothetical protein
MKKEKEVLDTLNEVRDLLVLIAAKLGASNVEVAKVLKCGESTLRKKVSFSGVSKDVK